MPNFTLPDSVFEAAASCFPTPFHIYHEQGIRETAKELHAAFAWNPGYREFFAVKALPNPAILNILREEGCGLDCSSVPELLLADQVGITGEYIMFTANAMPGQELREARGRNAFINLDDRSDVELLHRFGGVPEAVSLRVNPGPEYRTDNRFMGGGEDAKYGWMPSQIPEGLLRLKQLGAKRFGLHAMTASNSLRQEYYAQNAAFLFDLGLKLEKESGLTLAFINLAGGLGIPYLPQQSPVDIMAVGQQVEAAYRKAFGARNTVRIFTELGRFLTGPSGWLVSRVIHRKETWRTFIGLDASASNLLRPAMYTAYHHISIAGKRDMPHDQVYDVTGPLCENNDKFAIQRGLPQMDIGDLVLVHDTGAHGHAMGYQYNGRLRSAEILYTGDGSSRRKEDFRLIRRAETAEDYFATLCF